jgi:hypothetical protein
MSGYTLKDGNGDFIPQLFKNRAMALDVARQNHLPESAITQLFSFEKPEYKEPAEQKEDDGTA